MAETNKKNGEEESENKKVKVIDQIKSNYNNMNKMMVNEITLASIHGTLTGSNRENSWASFFRGIIPKKFALEKNVMIIDSYGNISKEVDICVFDEQYSPYVFQYNHLKFIPIESVAIVIECKSKAPDSENLREWAESIDNLETNSTGIARMATGNAMGITNKTQTKTTPIKILVSMSNNSEEKFDIALTLTSKSEEFQINIRDEDKTLGWWSRKLNCSLVENSEIEKNYLELSNFSKPCMDKIGEEEKRYADLCDYYEENSKLKIREVEEGRNKYLLENTLADLKIEGNPLLSLNMQLNQLLMLINNPMLFPHFAYARMFNTKFK